MIIIKSRVPPLVLTRSGNAGRASTLLSACYEVPTLALYASAVCSSGGRLPVQLCGQSICLRVGDVKSKIKINKKTVSV